MQEKSLTKEDDQLKIHSNTGTMKKNGQKNCFITG